MRSHTSAHVKKWCDFPLSNARAAGEISHFKEYNLILALKVIPLDRLQKIICSVIQDPWLLGFML